MKRLGRRVTVDERHRPDQRPRAGQPRSIQRGLDVIHGLQSFAGLAPLVGLDHNPTAIAEQHGDDNAHARRAKQHLRDPRPHLHHAKAIDDRVDLAQIMRPENDLLNQPAPLQPRVGIVAPLLCLAHSRNYRQRSRRLTDDKHSVRRAHGRGVSRLDRRGNITLR
jgi:hypothetical protein